MQSLTGRKTVYWIFSPLGIAVVIILIVAITSLIYWKRKPIRKWLHGRKVGVTLKAGPLEVSLDEKDKPKEAGGAPAGVRLSGDFSGAKVSGVAGRDIRRGEVGAETPSGPTPGVELKGKYGQAEVKDVAGRDIVEE
jgi:hypothetical protein